MVDGRVRAIPPGSGSRACSQGVPQEPGSPRHLHTGSRTGATGRQNPRAVELATWLGGKNETHATGVVRPSEGDEARRDGYRAFRASHSTREAGEASPWRPCGGKGMPDHGPVRGKHGECTETRNRVNETRTDSGSGEGASEVIFGSFFADGCVTDLTRSEAVIRGAGCGKSARPDLWELRVGNHPEPPGD